MVKNIVNIMIKNYVISRAAILHLYRIAWRKKSENDFEINLQEENIVLY